jgi:hypothetical protein
VSTGDEHDDAEFVDLVSDALYVPHAAPEIRMIAEVMASMSIPSSRYHPPLRAEVRGTRGRVLFGSRAAAAIAAVALALAGVTVSAYAGVLPSSIQDIAHHVIDAPAVHHKPGVGRPSGTDGTGGPGTSGAGSGQAAATTHGSEPQRDASSSRPAVAGKDTGASTASNVAPTTPAPSNTSSHGHGDNGHHKGSPTPTTTPSTQGSPGPTP